MRMLLRWREEVFDCEFSFVPAGGTLTLSTDGQLVWQEPVSSAAAAYDRARQVAELLLAGRAQRA